MKYLIIIVAIAFSVSCDYVDKPLGEVIGPSDSCLEPTFPANTNTKRNILVEDFTGHYCNNCPSAAYSIDTIKKNIGSQIIPVGIHVTQQFAAPQPSKAPKYQSEYRTEGGTSIKGSFAPAAGLPAIMVSRKLGFTSDPGRYNVYLSSLSSNIRSLIGDAPVVNMQIITSFDVALNEVCAYVETEVLNTLSDDHSVVFMLLEDSVVDWQLYNGAGEDPSYSAGDIAGYVHKHLLRKSMNGWQGKKILGASNAIGDKVIEGASFVVTNSTWDIHHLEVVAFVYNNTTKEVMQVVKGKI